MSASADLLRRAQEASHGVPGMGPAPALVHEPGGDVMRRLLHPVFGVFEQLYRALPEDGWFSPTVSNNRPVQFEIGSFHVPTGMTVLIYDYQFQVYRQSGVDPGDTMPAENGRFSSVMGFDINVNGKRPGNLYYQLDPLPVTTVRSSFSSPAGGPGFNAVQSTGFGATSGQGTSLLPVRRAVQGAENAPFTIIASNGDNVTMQIVIFKPVPAPIPFIEARMGGYLLNNSVASALIERMRPR